MNRALLGLTLTLVLATASVFVYSTDETGAAATLDGRSVFQAKGCIGCHQRGDLGQQQVGPDLTDLVSRADTRVEGLNAEDYVRQSVREPQAFIVPGYEANVLMPTLPLSDTELDALVEFLLEN
jgi:cytochrome c551/c552